MTQPFQIPDSVQHDADALFNGTLDQEGLLRLEAALLDNEPMQNWFLDYCQLHTDLHLASGADRALNAAVEALAETPPHAATPVPTVANQYVEYFRQVTPFSLTVATIALGLIVTMMAIFGPSSNQPVAVDTPDPEPAPIAQLTGLHQTVWAPGQTDILVGTNLRMDQRLDLKAGMAEISYPNGAIVLLRGPAVFFVRSEMLCGLQQGEMSVTVPPAARGFSVNTPVALIEDLGTQFTVRVASDGATDVDVLMGKVVAQVADTSGEVGEPHEITAGDALSVSADTLMVQRRKALPKAVATSLPTETPGQSLLSVDFQNTARLAPGVTQSGFVAFNETNGGTATYSTTAGEVTVTMSGLDAIQGGMHNREDVSNADRQTFAAVYNDFAFKNGESPQSMSLTLSGPGIVAGTAYNITFYSYDSDHTQGTHAVRFAGVSDTTGSAGPLRWTPAVPATLGQYAVSGVFTSDAAGTLTIDMTDTFSTQGHTGIRLNGFELSVVSELKDETNE